MHQILAYSILAAAKIVLVAIGFATIYQVVRFFHFAHAIVFTLGAYFTLLFSTVFNVPLLLSILLAVASCALVGCLMEICIYRPLRRKGASPLILLLASLGMYVVVLNSISIVFGDDTKSIRLWSVEEGIDMLGAKITSVQILIILAAIALGIMVAEVRRKTKLGKAMRAVACDPNLADVSGVNSNQVILWTFALGSALAGLAGVLVALDIDMTPTMGMNALMLGVIAVIIGGIRSIAGIAFGALVIGLTQNLAVWTISSQWQDAIAFVILLAFLIFRPEGFMGKKVAKATV